MKTLLSVLASAILISAGVRAQDGPEKTRVAEVPVQQVPASSAAIEFDVASIKLHSPDPSGRFESSIRNLPDGQVLTNASLRTLISRAYPSRGSNQIVGMPAWAEDLHYDVNVRANRPIAREEQAAMWRALLAERLKLAAHYEPRDEPSYDMVFARADHRLGPQMKPSTCTPVPPPARGAPPPATPPGPPTGAEVMARCSGFMSTGTRVFAPHTTVQSIAGFLRFGTDRQVIDKTGLEGFFDVEFSWSPPRPPGADAVAADPSEPPEFFTAVQDQLGFKLVPGTAKVEVLVIDHVEPPTEN